MSEKQMGYTPESAPGEQPKVGTKLGSEWVYHNTWKKDLPSIVEEGLGAGSFTSKPGFDFGRDTWIAVRLSDLRNPREHLYGKAIAIEPQWDPGGYDNDSHPITSSHVIPADRVVVVDKRGRVLASLASITPSPEEAVDLPLPVILRGGNDHSRQQERS